MFSLLDEFSGYNQVLVAEPDQLKTSFSHNSIWVGKHRCNISSAMDIEFHQLIKLIVVVYLDHVTTFSRQWSNHLCHLKKKIEQCRKYKISLNPKKSIFAMSEGNLLGHIIAKSEIKVYLDRFWTITQIPNPVKKKYM